MKKICTCLLFSIITLFAKAQFTVTGAGGAIPDGGATATCFPVIVSGVGTINGTYGLESVCLNIVHPWDADLIISLKGPDGQSVILSDENGGSGDNYTGTCFSGTAFNYINEVSPPFTGTYRPQQTPGIFNNGQNADGTWYLCVQDVFAGQVGTLVDFSLTFGNDPFDPIPNLPSCLNNDPAGDDCAHATHICNFDGYCGNTTAAYNVDIWPELSDAFCGSIENNSFLSFVAQASTVSLNVFVYNSLDDLGIQLFVFDGGCGAGAINTYGCYNEIFPGITPTLVNFTGLTPGNTYYMMIDGFAGDVCDYRIQAVAGVETQTADIVYTDSIACTNSAIPLVPTLVGAAGGTWSAIPAGLNINPSTGQIIPNLSTANDYTITYTVSATGSCPFQASDSAHVTLVDPNRYLWIGAVSTAWENPLNWSCGIVPDSTTNVVINHGTIVINSNVVINSLQLNTATTNLTVAPGWSLKMLSN